MNCRDALLRMLETEPADLRGEGDAALATHLAECPSCHATARQMLEEHDLLTETMAAVRPRRPAEEAVPAARREALRRRRRRRLWGAAPALAAAGIAGLLLAWPWEPAVEPAAAAAEPERPPLVESSTADGVTIMQTENPNIVVVWLTKARTES